MENRLKLLRKVKRITQKDIASYLGITQNAYSYWERGLVGIDHKQLMNLADYYGVTVEFIIGSPYVMKKPPENWPKELKDEYDAADEYKRIYMEYTLGEAHIVATDTKTNERKIPENTIIYHHNGKMFIRKINNAQLSIVHEMLNLTSTDEDTNEED